MSGAFIDELQHAISKGSVEDVFKMMVKHPRFLDSREFKTLQSSILRRAAAQGRDDIIEEFERRGSKLIKDISSLHGSLLHEAAECGRTSTVGLLLRLAPLTIDSTNFKNETPLSLAARHNHIDIVKLIFNQDTRLINKTLHGCASMHNAVENGHVEMVELLICLKTGGAYTNYLYEANTLIHVAARYGHAKIIEILHRAGYQGINTRNKDGETPLFLAVTTNQKHVVVTLLRLGCTEIDTPEKHGVSPLLFSLGSVNGFSMAKQLVRLGSRAIDTPDSSGLYPASAVNSADAMLAALGAQRVIEGFTPSRQDEEIVAGIRRSVYFKRSLSSRLLFENDRLTSFRKTSSAKRIK